MTTTPSLKSLVAVAVSGGVLIAGCGNGNPSPAEFRSKANAACKRYGEKLAKVGNAPQSVNDIPGLLDKTEPLLETEISELKDIDAPSGLQDDYDKFVSNVEDSKGTFSDLKSAAQDKDARKLQQIAQGAQKQAGESAALARKLKLDDCTRG